MSFQQPLCILLEQTEIHPYNGNSQYLIKSLGIPSLPIIIESDMSNVKGLFTWVEWVQLCDDVKLLY